MNISLDLLKQVVEIKEQIAAHEARLSKILASVLPSTEPASAKRGRKKMSAAGRAKIAVAQRARWVKIKGTSVAKPVKKKRHLSAKGRAAILAALKKRWALKRE
jgi:hypothetical protein